MYQAKGKNDGGKNLPYLGSVGTFQKGGGKSMITKRTVKMGEERFLEYIDDQTGVRIKQIPLDEIEYNHETAEALIKGHMRENLGVTYGKALVAISAKHPELFSEYIGDNTSEQIHRNEIEHKHRTAEMLIESHMKGNQGVTYSKALLVVSSNHPELFI